MYDIYSPLESPDWDQSTGFSQVPALDSSSDCCSTDSQESGSGSYSSPGLFSLTGSSVSTMDPSTLSQITDEIPFCLDSAVSSQDCRPLNTLAWRYSVHGSVEPGFSPTESYSRQSSAMNLSVAHQEPSVYELPGPYLPYERGVHGSIVGASPEASTHSVPELGYQYEQNHFGISIGCPSTDIKTFPGTLPAYYLHDGHIPFSGGYVPSAPAPHMRPLLPRSETMDLAGQPAYGSQRVLKPQIPGAHRSTVSSRVSSTAGFVQESPVDAVSPITSAAPCSHGMTRGPTTSVTCVADPVEQEFAAFIRLDQDEQAIPDHATYGSRKHSPVQVGSVMHGYQTIATEQTLSPSTIEPSPCNVEQDTRQCADLIQEKVPKAMSNASGSLAGESDEGRHRTHPLYNRPPDEDGMYRCPFKARESCPHKETKLKCNYDKYVDSHLKPFRCKVDACATMEFSSTACLLRHEREAHGMHGHGERPHLCYYTGCERGVNGNGFPRRYNLFDHMKRVHDHREDAADTTGSPVLGGETQKKPRGVKRKASSSPVAGQPAQKAVAYHHQPVMAIPLAHEAYYYPTGYFH